MNLKDRKWIYGKDKEKERKGKWCNDTLKNSKNNLEIGDGSQNWVFKKKKKTSIKSLLRVFNIPSN